MRSKVRIALILAIRLPKLKNLSHPKRKTILRVKSAPNILKDRVKNFQHQCQKMINLT